MGGDEFELVAVFKGYLASPVGYCAYAVLAEYAEVGQKPRPQAGNMNGCPFGHGKPQGDPRTYVGVLVGIEYMGDAVQGHELRDVCKRTRKDMCPAGIQQYGLVSAFDHVLVRLDHAFFFLFLPAQQKKPTGLVLVKCQASCFRHGYSSLVESSFSKKYKRTLFRKRNRRGRPVRSGQRKD